MEKIFDLKKITYFNQLEQYNTISQNEVQINSISYNYKIVSFSNTMMITDQFQLSNTYHELTRYTSLIPINHNLIEFLLLLFSNQYQYNR